MLLMNFNNKKKILDQKMSLKKAFLFEILQKSIDNIEKILPIYFIFLF